MARRNVRVLVADAQPVYRHGLRRALEEAGEFEVVAEASSGPDAIRAVTDRVPDLAFLDSALPPRCGLDVLEEMAGSDDSLPRTILVVPSADADHLLGQIRLGVCGVVRRCAPLALVVKAARCVASGEYWIGREAVGDLVRSFRAREAAQGDDVPQAHPGQRLTPREREIAAQVAAGHCNKDIAARFSLCEDTVKHHLSSVFAKLGVSSRLELAIFLMRQNGLVKKEPLSGV